MRSPRDDPFDKGDYTIVIDLDSTLIYSRKIEDPSQSLNDSTVSSHSFLRITQSPDAGALYHVYKRPHIDTFL